MAITYKKYIKIINYQNINIADSEILVAKINLLHKNTIVIRLIYWPLNILASFQDAIIDLLIAFTMDNKWPMILGDITLNLDKEADPATPA